MCLTDNSGQMSLGHLGKTHTIGAYCILRYIHITNNFGIVVLTVFKVALFPQTTWITKVTIEEVKINIVWGRGKGLHTEKDELFTRALA